jgi:hypothetical protein
MGLKYVCVLAPLLPLAVDYAVLYSGWFGKEGQILDLNGQIK